MKRYRVFINHAGKLQIVEVKRDELLASLKFDCYVIVVTVACFIVFCAAAGLI